MIRGPPAVATAMLLRELVQSAVQQDRSCFLRYLQKLGLNADVDLGVLQLLLTVSESDLKCRGCIHGDVS